MKIESSNFDTQKQKSRKKIFQLIVGISNHERLMQTKPGSLTGIKFALHTQAYRANKSDGPCN
jgi:hypothetical protein